MSGAAKRSVRVSVEFKREDCWVGVFWRTRRNPRSSGLDRHVTTWWICLIPMVPIVVTWTRDLLVIDWANS